jgi:hypothetical protein
MNVRLFCVLCVVQVARPMRRAGNSFRGLLPGVCLIVCDSEPSKRGGARRGLANLFTGGRVQRRAAN